MPSLTINQLDELAQEQRAQFLARPLGTVREVPLKRYLAHDRVVAITGVRRCGKSTLLRQAADTLNGTFHYFNFDDERARGFEVGQFELLMQAFQRHGNHPHLLFDEIQNVPEWERFVRRVHDDGIKVLLTGSNSQLLSQELGTRLTGRHIQLPLYPFSFKEYLSFHGISRADRTTAGKARLQQAGDRYLADGGFPEFLRHADPELLQRTYDDILYRDIAARHGIRETKALAALAQLLFTQVSSDLNFGRLKEALHLASATTVRQFVGYLEDACLVYEVRRFDFSLKRQYITGRKIYVVDNGMRRAVAFTTSPDAGRLLENAVHLELRRRGGEVYFFREKGDCDFIYRHRGATVAIQVCLRLSEENRTREMRGLQEAARALGHQSGVMVTLDQEGEETVGGIQVTSVPAWRWLLEGGA